MFIKYKYTSSGVEMFEFVKDLNEKLYRTNS